LQKFATFKTSICNTLSMRARVGTCTSVSIGKSCAMSLKKALQNCFAPNIVK